MFFHIYMPCIIIITLFYIQRSFLWSSCYLRYHSSHYHPKQVRSRSLPSTGDWLPCSVRAVLRWADYWHVEYWCRVLCRKTGRSDRQCRCSWFVSFCEVLCDGDLWRGYWADGCYCGCDYEQRCLLQIKLLRSHCNR